MLRPTSPPQRCFEPDRPIRALSAGQDDQAVRGLPPGSGHAASPASAEVMARNERSEATQHFCKASSSLPQPLTLGTFPRRSWQYPRRFTGHALTTIEPQSWILRFSHQESVLVEGCDRRRWPGLQRVVRDFQRGPSEQAPTKRHSALGRLTAVTCRDASLARPWTANPGEKTSLLPIDHGQRPWRGQWP